VKCCALCLPIVLAAGGPAYAGSASAELGTDFLRATSHIDDPPRGIPERFDSNELGFRLRGDLTEPFQEEGLFGVHVDYRAREPFLGNLRNSTVRILYRCEATIDWDWLTIGVGRFLAPSALLLPVDGANATVLLWPGFEASVFGGRRGVSTSRRNIGFDRHLPAIGGTLSLAISDFDVEAGVAYAEDELVLFNGTQERTDDFGGVSGYARVLWHLERELFVGVTLSFLEQAAYVIGPSWTELEVVSEALGFWSGSIFVQWYPLPELRLSADFHTQGAAAVRGGTRHEIGDAAFTASEDAPRFWETRARAGWQFLEGSRADAEVRLRRRTLWTELRYRAAVTFAARSVVEDIPVVSDLYAHGALIYDDLFGAYDTDRLYFEAALGWRDGPFDVSAGVRMIERGPPYSGRAFAPPGQDDSPAIEDLSPFVLEAQQIAFVRAFWSGTQWYGGIDFEQNLEDSEYRVFFQSGVFWEDRW
jgi:hypothetical protein